MEIKKMAVIGAGTMGAGIAQVAVEAGIEVTLCDVEDRFVSKGKETIQKFINRKAEKGQITKEAAAAIVGRLSGTIKIEEALAGVGMVIEAIVENMSVKQDLFKRMDAIAPESVILSSNTSTLSIAKIGEATKHPARVIGTHFFSPVPLMKLVEVIRGEKTSDETAKTTLAVVEKLGKTPILAPDIPGFIVNRFMLLLYNEGANLVHDGLARPEDVDKGMRLGANHPMGPLEVADLAGVDVCFYALKAVYEATQDVRYRPSPLWEKMIKEGKLGRKTKQGFYKYE